MPEPTTSGATGKQMTLSELEARVRSLERQVAVMDQQTRAMYHNLASLQQKTAETSESVIKSQMLLTSIDERIRQVDKQQTDAMRSTIKVMVGVGVTIITGLILQVITR